MHPKGLRPAAATLAAAILFGACTSAGGLPAATGSPAGGQPGVTPSPAASSVPGASPSPSPASNELVLRVVLEGGFVAPSARLAQLPIVAVYADGRIFSPGPVTMEYPGRLVPPLQVRSVGADGARAILAAAGAAGLTTADASYPAVGVADAPDTVFVIVDKGTRITTRFGALAEGRGVPGGQGASEPARKAALDFLARLTDMSDAFGATATAPTIYVPTAFRVWVSPGAPAGSDPALAQQPVSWPLVAPLASLGVPVTPGAGTAGMRVGIVAGPDAATLEPIFARANALTPFTSGGATFSLLVRPLLPDETPAP